MSDVKTCTKCGIEKPLSEFYRFKPRPRNPSGGYFSECKECNRSRARTHMERLRREEPARVAAVKAKSHRTVKLRDKYGVTPAEYDAMLATQGAKCAICGTADPGRDSTFFPIDHDHETGAVRGLLCHYCNLGIGHFFDDPERLVAAAAYLLATRDVLQVVT